jgi:hypothetical protein
MTLTQAELDRIANKYRSMAERMDVDTLRDLPDPIIDRLESIKGNLMQLVWELEDTEPRVRPVRKR